MTRKRFDPAEVDAFNEMDALQALARLGLTWKADDTFKPRKSPDTMRGHVPLLAAQVAELLVNGSRWFDTRARQGGVGAISLAMHLLDLTFVAAVCRLQQGGRRAQQGVLASTSQSDIGGTGRAAMR